MKDIFTRIKDLKVIPDSFRSLHFRGQELDYAVVQSSPATTPEAALIHPGSRPAWPWKKIFPSRRAERISDAQPAPLNDNEPQATFREKFDLVKGFWISDQKWKARGTMAIIFGLIILDVACGAGVALSVKGAIDGLKTAAITKDIIPVMTSLATAAGASLVQTMAIKQKDYKNLSLAVAWRSWMTDHLQDAWLADKSYNKMARKKGEEHHPDQRIAQDASDVTDQAMSFAVCLFKSTLNIATFSVLLSGISPVFAAVAVGVAVGNSFITNRIGRSLQKKNTDIANREAVLRSALADIRNNSDHIALTDLENVEKQIAKNAAQDVYAAKHAQLKLERNLGFFTDFSSKASDIIPVALAAPFVAASGLGIGSIELARRYYNSLSSGANWLTEGYPLWARFNASSNRLVNFSKALAETKDYADIKAATPASPPLKPG